MRILCILITACLSTLVWTQNTFSVVHHNQNYLGGSGRSVFEVEDGYLLYSVQWSLDSTVSALYIAKYDLSGIFQWVKEHRRVRTIDPGIIDPIANNSNGTYTAAIASRSAGDLDSLHLYHFDANGDTLNTYFINADASQGVRDCIVTEDGNYLIAGFCTLTTDPIDDCGCLRKVTPQGEELWRRNWPQWTYVHNIMPTSDGKFILGASRASQEDPACIAKVDADGNLEWNRYWGGWASGGLQPIEQSNGNIMVPGSWNDSLTILPSGFRYAAVKCYSPTGDALWQKYVRYTSSASVSRAVEMGNEEFFVIGSYWQASRDPDIAATLWRINSEGDTLYSRKYWYFSGYRAENIASRGASNTSDGGLIMTGVVRQSTTGEQPLLYSTWLLKLDSLGCLVPGCHTVGVADYEMALQSALHIAPNPASEAVRFQLALPEEYPLQGAVQAVLLDGQGREVLRQPVQPNAMEVQGTLPTANLPSGLYFLHLHDDAKWLAGGKVVKE